eukprot:UN13268
MDKVILIPFFMLIVLDAVECMSWSDKHDNERDGWVQLFIDFFYYFSCLTLISKKRSNNFLVLFGLMQILYMTGIICLSLVENEDILQKMRGLTEEILLFEILYFIKSTVPWQDIYDEREKQKKKE